MVCSIKGGGSLNSARLAESVNVIVESWAREPEIMQACVR